MTYYKSALQICCPMALLTLGMSTGISQAQDSHEGLPHETRLKELLLNGVTVYIHYDHERGWFEKQPVRKARAWQLFDIWRLQDKEQVTAQAIPFLQDEYWVFRQNAAVILGRTESAAAEPLLQKILTDGPDAKTGWPVPLEILKLALARNRSRDLKGKAKLEALAQGVGLTFEELMQLPVMLRNTKYYTKSSPAECIVFELLDMLYSMGEKGENIQPWIEQLTLFKGQKLMLQVAGLPPEQKAKQLVEYLAGIDAIRPPETTLLSIYLPQLGLNTIRAVVGCLSEKGDNVIPLAKLNQTAMRRAVLYSAGPEAIPIINPLVQSPAPWVHDFAIRLSVDIEKSWHSTSINAVGPATMQLILEN